MAMFLPGALYAQDTIESEFPVENLFYNNYPEDDTIVPTWTMASMRSDIVAKFFTTNVPLKIYGIAAAIYHPRFVDSLCRVPYGVYGDHTYDSCIESLRLYRADSATLTQLGEDLVVSVLQTPVSYYWILTKTYLRPGYDHIPVLPVYERYFDEPFVVEDSFYVAFTQYNYYSLPDGRESRYGLAPAAIYPINQKFPSYEEKRTEYYESRWHYFWPAGYQACSLLFPILAPGDTDTTGGGGGGDPQAVEGPEMLRRMVSVSPNPASKEAKVVSSFGLTRIEAYGADGRKVLDCKVEGFASTIDIAAWPSGTYMLRVHTPMGVVGRKLVVR